MIATSYLKKRLQQLEPTANYVPGNAPPVYRPPHRIQSLQPKAANYAPGNAPPVYRPPHRIQSLQPKVANYAPGNAPPVYRPPHRIQSLQPKAANYAPGNAPPVYRPPHRIQSLQPKAANYVPGNAPPLYRPQGSQSLQPKASNYVSGTPPVYNPSTIHPRHFAQVTASLAAQGESIQKKPPAYRPAVQAKILHTLPLIPVVVQRVRTEKGETQYRSVIQCEWGDDHTLDQILSILAGGKGVGDFKNHRDTPFTIVKRTLGTQGYALVLENPDSTTHLTIPYEKDAAKQIYKLRGSAHLSGLHVAESDDSGAKTVQEWDWEYDIGKAKTEGTATLRTRKDNKYVRRGSLGEGAFLQSGKIKGDGARQAGAVGDKGEKFIRRPSFGLSPFNT